MNTAIKVEHLTKSYVITHHQQGNYMALRDVIAEKTKNLFKTGGQLQKRNDSLLHKKENFLALNNISFEVNKGDRIGIIGRNGAGKSTLLKVLSRITEPSTGRISIKGRVTSLLEVGTGFHPELTGRENIYLNGAVLGMQRAEIKSKFDEIVDFSGVEKFLDTPVKRYSSGMYVRLAFAVAANLGSEILIVDEVLAVGDAEFQRKCLGKMGEVSRAEGRTILFVSHNMSAIRRLCTKGHFLRNGKTVLDGDIDTVITEYLSDKDLERSYNYRGIGGIKVTELKFRDEIGNEIKTFSTHDSITIALKCTAEKCYEKTSFAICFDNVFETRVMSLWSSYIGKDFEVQEGNFEIVFNVKTIKLLPEEYYITTYIASRGYEVERIDKFMKVSVSFVANYGLVVEPQVSQGYYLEEFSVNIKN